MLKRIILIIFLVLVVFLNWPKVHFSVEEGEVEVCSCFGHSSLVNSERRVCYGVPYSCETKVSEVFEKELEMKYCSIESCEDMRSYLGFEDSGEVEVIGNESGEVFLKGLNLLLVMDISVSMQGENIQETKAASALLIEELSLDDQVGVVTFNNKATVVHEFSNDKASVIKSIDGILVGEDTRYVPALKAAEDMFNRSIKGKRNVLIFLSDGDPLDDTKEILSKADGLKQANVEIYTVWFGDTASSSNTFLQRMASSLSGDDGVRFFKSKDRESLFNSFKKIYDSVKEEEYHFKLDWTNRREVYYEGEQIGFDMNLFSGENLVVIPGFTIEGAELFCAERADIILDFKRDKNDVYQTDLVYVPNSYRGSIEELKEGSYAVYANISVKFGLEDSCMYEDYQFLGRLNVIPIEKEETCETDCAIVEEIMTDMDVFSHDSGINSGEKVVILVDSSESMNNRVIAKAKYSMKYLIDLLSRNYEVALVSFSDNATLLHEFSNDGEALKESVNGIITRGSTKYVNGLEKAYDLLDYGAGGVGDIVIISDGKSWDNDETKIFEMIESFGRVSIYSVGYGKGILESENLLIKMAEKGNGKYFQAFEYDLRETFREVFQEISGLEDPLELDVKISSQALELDEPLMMDVGVFSDFNGLVAPGNVSYLVDGEMQDVCIPKANVVATISDGEKVASHELPYYDGRGYAAVIKGIKEGDYLVTLNATVDGCAVNGYSQFEVTAAPEDKEFNENFILFGILNVLLVIIKVGLAVFIGKDLIIDKERE